MSMIAIAFTGFLKGVEEGHERDRIGQCEVCRLHLDIDLLSALGYLTGDVMSVVFL